MVVLASPDVADDHMIRPYAKLDFSAMIDSRNRDCRHHSCAFTSQNKASSNDAAPHNNSPANLGYKNDFIDDTN